MLFSFLSKILIVSCVAVANAAYTTQKTLQRRDWEVIEQVLLLLKVDDDKVQAPLKKYLDSWTGSYCEKYRGSVVQTMGCKAVAVSTEALLDKWVEQFVRVKTLLEATDELSQSLNKSTGGLIPADEILYQVYVVIRNVVFDTLKVTMQSKDSLMDFAKGFRSVAVKYAGEDLVKAIDLDMTNIMYANMGFDQRRLIEDCKNSLKRAGDMQVLNQSQLMDEGDDLFAFIEFLQSSPETSKKAQVCLTQFSEAFSRGISGLENKFSLGSNDFSGALNVLDNFPSITGAINLPGMQIDIALRTSGMPTQASISGAIVAQAQKDLSVYISLNRMKPEFRAKVDKAERMLKELQTAPPRTLKDLIDFLRRMEEEPKIYEVGYGLWKMLYLIFQDAFNRLSGKMGAEAFAAFIIGFLKQFPFLKDLFAMFNQREFDFKGVGDLPNMGEKIAAPKFGVVDENPKDPFTGKPHKVSKLSLGAIAGLIALGVAIVVAVIAIVLCCCRSKKKYIVLDHEDMAFVTPGVEKGEKVIQVYDDIEAPASDLSSCSFDSIDQASDDFDDHAKDMLFSNHFY